MITTDKNEVSYWENIQLKDLIQLSDEQTIEYLMEKGHKNIEHGADFTVTRKRVITAQQGPSKWFVFDISFANFVWILVVKTVGADFDLKIYYIPDDFVEGNRDDVLDNDFAWLFDEPENLDDYKSSELSFAKEIEEDDNVLFISDGLIYGECREGAEKSFATVVEYSTTSDLENPNMMILEFNNIEEWSEKEVVEVEDEGYEGAEVTVTQGVNIDEENSFITLLQGCKVNMNDVSLLK